MTTPHDAAYTLLDTGDIVGALLLVGGMIGVYSRKDSEP